MVIANRWRVGLAFGGLAVAAAVLAGLYVDAAGGRSDERRRATDLAAREAAARAEAAALQTEATAARERADAAEAQFAAVEPCLRAIVATPTPQPGKGKLRVITQEELDAILRGERGGELILPPAGTKLFPACKDVAKQLK
jgi:hypothetical protein